MADFFEPTPDPQEDKQVEKIRIGEEEFEPSELEDIVKKGRFAKEVEEKYNTKLDKVWPEYTKTTQELKALREEKAKWDAERKKEIETTPNNELSEEDLVKKTRLEAKRLGLVTVDDIDNYITQRMTTIQQANDMLNDCRKLESEYNGEDGRPKFNTEEILSYMQETGIKIPVKAYKDKYETELEKWKEEQINGARKKGVYTETGLGGNKEPIPVKLSKTNLADAIGEVLHSSNEE